MPLGLGAAVEQLGQKPGRVSNSFKGTGRGAQGQSWDFRASLFLLSSRPTASGEGGERQAKGKGSELLSQALSTGLPGRVSFGETVL